MGVVIGSILEYTGIHTVVPQVTGWTFTVIFPWAFLIISFVLTIVITIIAGFYPSRIAVRQNIVEAVQYE